MTFTTQSAATRGSAWLICVIVTGILAKEHALEIGPALGSDLLYAEALFQLIRRGSPYLAPETITGWIHRHVQI